LISQYFEDEGSDILELVEISKQELDKVVDFINHFK